MVKVSRITHKKPIAGLRDPPYRETYTRDFGLYLWWAFCVLPQSYIKFMILAYAIMFGVLLKVLDFSLSKLFKRDELIIRSAENVINRITGNSLLAKLILILGIPLVSFYIITVVPENSHLNWIFAPLGIISLGYLGVVWLEGRNLQFPRMKRLIPLLLLVGIAMWLLWIMS